MAQTEKIDAEKTLATVTKADVDGMRKTRITGRLLAVFTLGFFFIANLPYQYVEVESYWLGHLDLPESQQGGDKEMPVMGGWPLRYAVAYPHDAELRYREWRPLFLGLNVALGFASSWAICWFLAFRFRSLSVVPESNRRRLWFDGLFAFLIFAIPTLVVGGKAWEPYQQQQLAKQFLRDGNFAISAWLPEFIEPHVPRVLKKWLSAVRHVRLTSATPSTAKQIASIPTLVSLHSYGGEYGTDTFDELGKRLHFDSLLLANSKINQKETAAISKLRWVKHLKFPGTSLTPKQFHCFDELPLVSVDLQGTGLAYRELAEVKWARSCELLWLSRPANGISDALSLEDWSNLKSLWIKRRNYELNDAVLGIRLANLPSLRRLCLDRAQKHDLTLINVPRLASLEEEIVDARFVATDNYRVPGLTWVRNLEVSGADSLSELTCYAKDLEQLQLGQLPNLQKLKLGSYLVTLMGNVIPQEADSEKCRRWVSYLGDRSGPYEIDLGYLPLQGIELSPLSQNTGIQQLNLNGTFVDFSQLQQIGSAKKYKSLDARTTPLKGREFIELLHQFPDLDQLLVDGSDLQYLGIEQNDQLKFLHISTMRKVRNVLIVDQPKMNTSLQMVANPVRLKIENVPGLAGLSLVGPWPADSSISGLRDLEWFAGGGVDVDDRIAKEVLACTHLHRLTMAYPSVSREMLFEVGKLNELVSLSLPGTMLDDEVVSSWKGVNDLWEVNFNDTKIGAQTIVWLTRMPSLRRVSINRLAVDEAMIQAIVALRQICELHLEGTQIPSESLSKLLQNGHLEVLNLSGWQLDEKLIQMLEQHGKGLTHLILDSQRFDVKTFRRLMQISDSVFINTIRYPEELSEAEIATIHERADAVRRQTNSGWRLMLESPQDVGLGMNRSGFLNDRQRRIKQRETPWMPSFFSVSLAPEKFRRDAQESQTNE
ncbi:MAG: hypothetical protein ISQ09_05335 [Rubripirellula sp.]|nr:hypothetical protein [Rubripirellula sp.]